MKLWIEFPRAFWWVCAAMFLVLMLSPVWASDDDDCEYNCDDDTLTQADADAFAWDDYERDKMIAEEEHQQTEQQVARQQITIESLQQELERLRDEAAAKAAEDEARRIALGEALKNYQVVKDNDT